MGENKVIAISGITAAGKTTLACALAKELKATAIHWDDFDELSKSPQDYVEWYRQGENYDEWDYSLLAKLLELLKKGQKAIHPALGSILEPTDFIIFDAPLGKLHKQTGRYIDLCVHITLPLDVLLARRLLRDFASSNQSKENLLKELNFYLLCSRPLFFDTALKESADIVVDGLSTTKAQILSIKKMI